MTRNFSAFQYQIGQEKLPKVAIPPIYDEMLIIDTICINIYINKLHSNLLKYSE
jgi:hypothetical protein